MPDDGSSSNEPEVFTCNLNCLLPCAPTQRNLYRAGLELAMLLIIDILGNSKPSIVNDNDSVREIQMHAMSVHTYCKLLN